MIFHAGPIHFKLRAAVDQGESMSATNNNRSQEIIELPAPTAWPMITALGITLLCAGFGYTFRSQCRGSDSTLRGAVGWFREDLPAERHELVRLRPLAERAVSVKVSPRTAAHLRAGEAGHRVRIPAEIHPYSSGIKGGLLGGVVMAIVACAYGLIAYGSVWYPINLLAAAALPSMAHADLAQLKAFDSMAFFVALISHGAISILVGLLFAVLLPMFPSRRAASGAASCLRCSGRAGVGHT